MDEYKAYQGLHDLFCPLCNHSIGVRGERTEIFHQYVAHCRHCKCEFVVNYFMARDYTNFLKRSGVNDGNRN